MTKAERKAMSTKGFTPGFPVSTEPITVQNKESNQMANETNETANFKAKLVKKTGKTRGKNTKTVTYDAFDKEQPETLPKTMKEFMAVTDINKEPEILDLLIDGYNAAQYAAASDEIGEFVEDYWDKTFTDQFRLMIRNGSKMMSKSIEDTVAMYKPAIDAGWIVRKAELDKAKAEADAKAKADAKTDTPEVAKA